MTENKYIKWPDGALDAWQVNDKTFMKQRRQEWARVKKNLVLLKTYIQRPSHKQHRELFMTGNIIDTFDPNEIAGPQLSYNGTQLLFQLWYYPDNDLDVFNQLFELSGYTQISGSRSQFATYCKGLRNCDPDYGLMGGREENVFRALYPSYDNNETRLHSGGSEIRLGPAFETIVEHISNAYNPTFSGREYNRYVHGRCIWDYMEYYLDKKGVEEYKLRDTTYELFYRALFTAKYKEQKVARFAKDDDDVVELADNLRQRFENREFNAGLMAIWDNIDDLYHQYNK